MLKKFVGVVLGFVCIPFLFTAAIAEVDIQAYGSVRFQTAIVQHSKETHNIPFSVFSAYNGLAPTANSDYQYLSWELEPWVSRFGVNFKSGRLGGNVELRPVSSSIYRHWYGTYDFDFGRFLIGHTWNPIFLCGCMSESYFFSGIQGGPAAEPYNGLREEQIRLEFPLKSIGLATIAFIKPNDNITVTGLSIAKVETTVPNLVATLHSKPIGPVSLVAYGGYHTVNLESASGESYTLDSYVAGLGPRFTFGPFKFNVNLWKGKNPNVYHYSPNYPFSYNVYDAASNAIQDADLNYGLMMCASYQVNKNFKVQLDYGLRETELPSTATTVGYTRRLSVFTFAAPFCPFKDVKVTIRPEVDYVDWGELEYKNGAPSLDLGTSLVYGIYWQFDF